MYYVKFLDVPYVGGAFFRTYRKSRMYKTLAAAKRYAAKYDSAAVVDNSTGQYVSYGSGGMVAFHTM